MSSFSGVIKELPNISVDRFDGRNLASTAYFLSHAHSDHMEGLSSPHLLDHLESNRNFYLYCSQITARFLHASIRHKDLSPYILPLQLEESVKITIPNTAAEAASYHLWVTLIPAAHCPGSVMFLFEGKGGTVLYTGDFRISVGEVSRIQALHEMDGTVKVIDSLHIDTTFCHKDIMYFPTREESVQALEEAVEEWLAKGNNYLIHLFCPAKYGYEFIYRSLHDRFGMKIHMSRWKYKMYDTVPEIQDLLTLDASATWIHNCEFTMNDKSRGENRKLPCRCVPYGAKSDPQIRVIKPSALFFTMYQNGRKIKEVSEDGKFCRILVSMHASCSEVLDMVSYLRPRQVLPNVIPVNSNKEEVLKLLHEALNSSGDHYSIEYNPSQRSSLFGSFQRPLDSESFLAENRNLFDSDSFIANLFASSHKRRRHSDSNMIPVFPNAKTNIKGSLSLETDVSPDAKEIPSTSKVVTVYHKKPCKRKKVKVDKSPGDEMKIVGKSMEVEKFREKIEEEEFLVDANVEMSNRKKVDEKKKEREEQINGIDENEDSSEIIWEDPYTPSPPKDSSQRFFDFSANNCNRLKNTKESPNSKNISFSQNSFHSNTKSPTLKLVPPTINLIPPDEELEDEVTSQNIDSILLAFENERKFFLKKKRAVEHDENQLFTKASKISRKVSISPDFFSVESDFKSVSSSAHIFKVPSPPILIPKSQTSISKCQSSPFSFLKNQSPPSISNSAILKGPSPPTSCKGPTSPASEDTHILSSETEENNLNSEKTHSEQRGNRGPANIKERRKSEGKESETKKRRKLWYKHKHFSTPVSENDKEILNENSGVGDRSSSLPEKRDQISIEESSQIKSPSGETWTEKSLTKSSQIEISPEDTRTEDSIVILPKENFPEKGIQESYQENVIDLEETQAEENVEHYFQNNNSKSEQNNWFETCTKLSSEKLLNYDIKNSRAGNFTKSVALSGNKNSQVENNGSKSHNFNFKNNPEIIFTGKNVNEEIYLSENHIFKEKNKCENVIFPEKSKCVPKNLVCDTDIFPLDLSPAKNRETNNDMCQLDHSRGNFLLPDTETGKTVQCRNDFCQSDKKVDQLEHFRDILAGSNAQKGPKVTIVDISNSPEYSVTEFLENPTAKFPENSPAESLETSDLYSQSILANYEYERKHWSEAVAGQRPSVIQAPLVNAEPIKIIENGNRDESDIFGEKIEKPKKYVLNNLSSSTVVNLTDKLADNNVIDTVTTNAPAISLIEGASTHANSLTKYAATSDKSVTEGAATPANSRTKGAAIGCNIFQRAREAIKNAPDISRKVIKNTPDISPEVIKNMSDISIMPTQFSPEIVSDSCNFSVCSFELDSGKSTNIGRKYGKSVVFDQNSVKSVDFDRNSVELDNFDWNSDEDFNKKFNKVSDAENFLNLKSAAPEISQEQKSAVIIQNKNMTLSSPDLFEEASQKNLQETGFLDDKDPVSLQHEEFPNNLHEGVADIYIEDILNNSSKNLQKTLKQTIEEFTEIGVVDLSTKPAVDRENYEFTVGRTPFHIQGVDTGWFSKKSTLIKKRSISLKCPKFKRLKKQELNSSRNSAKNSKKKTKRSHNSTKSVEKSTECSEKSAKSLEKSTECSEKSTESLENSTKRSEKSAKSSEKNTERSHNSTKSLEKSTESSEKSAESFDKSPIFIDVSDDDSTDSLGTRPSICKQNRVDIRSQESQ